MLGHANGWSFRNRQLWHCARKTEFVAKGGDTFSLRVGGAPELPEVLNRTTKCSAQNDLCSFSCTGEKTNKSPGCAEDVSTSLYVRGLVCFVLHCLSILLFSLRPTVAHFCHPHTQLNSDGWLQWRVSYKTGLVHSSLPDARCAHVLCVCVFNKNIKHI